MTIKNWKSETDDNGILWLCLDLPDSKVNVLSSSVLQELNDIIDAMKDDPPSGLVLWSGKQDTFVMGADIKEFTKVDSIELANKVVRQGQGLMDKVEELSFPTVVAINGFCLGGGLELSMACDYRIVFEGSRKILGLPEVKLGLHPGFGGTVRSVQICGVRAGMQLMLTGAPIAPGKAKAIGLVDRITSEERWRADAIELINSKPPKNHRLPGILAGIQIPVSLEGQMLLGALVENGWDKAAAARAIGWSRQRLYRQMKAYELPLRVTEEQLHKVHEMIESSSAGGYAIPPTAGA